MKAIAYVRVSSEEQKKEGVSVDAQKEKLRTYAEFRGLELVDILVDEGASAGKPVSKRPAGRAILERVASGEVQAVIATKLDRLFRDVLDCLALVEMLDRGEKCVCELVEAVDAERTSVSKHLAILKNAGIISDRRKGVSIFYRLEVPCILRFLDCIDAVVESNVKKVEERKK